MAVLKRFTSSLSIPKELTVVFKLAFTISYKLTSHANKISNDPMIVHLKTGWLEAHFIGFIGKRRKELGN
jgi:hypothetical protein